MRPHCVPAVDDWRQLHSSLTCVPESPPCYPLLIVQCKLNSSHAPWSVCSSQVCLQSPNFTFNSYSSLRLPQIFLAHHFWCATCTQWALGYQRLAYEYNAMPTKAPDEHLFNYLLFKLLEILTVTLNPSVPSSLTSSTK